MGPTHHGVKPITLNLNGTLDTSLFGKQTFTGAVTIVGSTIPNRDNGKPLEIVLNSQAGGGQMVYWDRSSNTFYTYGSMYSNRRFNEFTIAVFQPEGKGQGWNGGNGLMLSAPAQTRTEALQISNELMKDSLFGRVLK